MCCAVWSSWRQCYKAHKVHREAICRHLVSKRADRTKRDILQSWHSIVAYVQERREQWPMLCR